MDAVMPLCDGISATRTLREKGDRIPVLGLTAQANAMQAFLDAGADGVLIKPFTIRSLLAKIGEISPD
jgi:DNA-binding response OmpR family regulator